jgi:hypothetical protein
MICAGPLPPGKYGPSFRKGEPPKSIFGEYGSGKDWSAKNFTGLADLCTANGNPQGNMGGIVRISTPDFWAMVFLSQCGDTSFFARYNSEVNLLQHH